MYIKGEVKGKMRHTSKIILAVGIALSLLSCGEEGTSEPLEYPEESSAEICSSSENAPISVSSDSEDFSSSEDLVVSSSSDVVVSSSVGIGSSSSSIESSSSSSPNIRYISYGEMTDERDGQLYKTMTIEYFAPGWDTVPRQTWMVENLKYAYLQPTAELDSSSWCYDNNPDNCERYGRLYLWSAVMDSAALFSDEGKGCGYYLSKNEWHKCLGYNEFYKTIRGVCPEGWHVPSYDEHVKTVKYFDCFVDFGCYDFDSEKLVAGYYDSEEKYFWGQGGVSGASLWLSSDYYCDEAYVNAYLPLLLYDGWRDEFAVDLSSKKIAAALRCVKDVPD